MDITYLFSNNKNQLLKEVLNNKKVNDLSAKLVMTSI